MSKQQNGAGEPPLHVLEVAGNAIVGGMERYVYNLAKRLPAHGFKVTCLVPYESAFTDTLRRMNCDVYVTPMDLDPPWRSIQMAVELVRSSGVNLIHAHLPRAHVLAGLAGRLTGVPAVATVHGMEVISPELSIFRTTQSYLTTVCHQAYFQALSVGVSAERLFMVANGVDTEVFTPVRSGEQFRQALGVPEIAPLVGFVGRLAWEKGPDQFVNLAQRIHAEMPEVHFVMVGTGPMENAMREAARNPELEGRLHLAGLCEETAQVYPALDVLVQTSRVEGMPLALLEAMSCGVPVAAMGVGGVIEIIEADRSGILAAGGDWAGLAGAVMGLLRNPERAQTMGQNARERVEARFSLEDNVGQLAALFKQLIAQHNSHGGHQRHQNGAKNGISGRLTLPPAAPNGIEVAMIEGTKAERQHGAN